jgi:protein TonB
MNFKTNFMSLSKQHFAEKNKSFFFNIGLVTAIALSLLAFEWQIEIKQFQFEEDYFVDLDFEEAIPITKAVETQPKLILNLAKPTFINIQPLALKIVKNTTYLETQTEIPDFTELYIPENEVEENLNTIFNATQVSILPQFPGELNGFLSEHLKYPYLARYNGIAGKVYISFVINKDGSVTDIEPLTNCGFGLEEEAIRVIKLMPKWVPAQQGERKVNVRIKLPIAYKIG